jgi:hypothetical protein
MSTRLRSLLIALPVLALLAVPGAALAAKTRTKVEPARTTGVVKVRGTNGWRIQITGMASGSHPGTHVAVYARGPHHQEVSYIQFPSRFTKGGTIHATLPGVGYIDLRYEPTDHHKTEMSYEPGCTGAPTTVESSGIFRGKIELHGTDGFTTVDTHTARGELQVEPRQTCRLSPRPKVKIKHEIEATESGYEAVSAARGLAGGILTFDASSISIPLRGSSTTRWVEFRASYIRQLHGMLFSASTQIGGEDTKGLSILPSTASPTKATVKPPAPFAGNAEFALESPSVASWTGNLSVAIPTLGTVALAGPRFNPLLCGAGGCTEAASEKRPQVFSGAKFEANFFPG